MDFEFILFICLRVGVRVQALIERLSVELTSEARRRGCWGLLGQCTGAMIVDQNEEPVLRERLFNADGSVKDENLVFLDPKTGLIMPNPLELFLWLPDARRGGDTCKVEIPPGFFIHPVTARAMPIEGKFAHFQLRNASSLGA